jgi:hypothetical protein
VRAALGRYADRGVFRGFSEQARPGGATEFRFTWLTREPLVLRYDPRDATLTFRGVLPGVARGSRLLAEVQAFVAARHKRSLPAHRRIDRRRVDVVCAHRRGTLDVVLRVKGENHGYAVTKGVNLVGEIFTLLQASYPEFVWEAFGVPVE